MGVLRDGDEPYHYENGAHRWVAPSGVDQRAWTAGVRAHLERHQANMGGDGRPPRRLQKR